MSQIPWLLVTSYSPTHMYFTCQITVSRIDVINFKSKNNNIGNRDLYLKSNHFINCYPYLKV